MLMTFLTIFAWIGSVVGGLAVLLIWFLAYQYEGSLEQKMDRLRGVRVRWPMGKWAFLAFLLGTVFLIAKALN